MRYILQSTGLGREIERPAMNMGLCSKKRELEMCGPRRTCIEGRCVSSADLKYFKWRLSQSMSKQVVLLRGHAEHLFQDVIEGSRPAGQAEVTAQDPVLRLFAPTRTSLEDIARFVRKEDLTLSVNLRKTQEHVKTLAMSAALFYSRRDARQADQQERRRILRKIRLRLLGYEEKCTPGEVQHVYEGGGRVTNVYSASECSLHSVGTPYFMLPENRQRTADAIEAQLNRQPQLVRIVDGKPTT